eukprot:484138_1
MDEQETDNDTETNQGKSLQIISPVINPSSKNSLFYGISKVKGFHKLVVQFENSQIKQRNQQITDSISQHIMAGSTTIFSDKGKSKAPKNPHSKQNSTITFKVSKYCKLVLTELSNDKDDVESMNPFDLLDLNEEPMEYSH